MHFIASLNPLEKSTILKKNHLEINSSFISSMHMSLLSKNFMAQRVNPSLGGTIKNITPSFYFLIITFIFLEIKNLMMFFFP